MRKFLYSFFFFTYQIVRQLRYGLLASVFGITIHCKHTPTCGTYLFTSIRQDGIVRGSYKGIIRVLTCW